ncbi:hypothetical protein BGZ61DRAFT_343755 [Ilyonectria robusta]|uniref:uncharacterized protein n=1 Tax=Ilyonectria robusta TaxID=1079257 RepID=UPI001E8DE6E8|nr:uncharacterized protein BGZ61DRAFT_343755 [Ilyonectria robusta]KAH8733920.1 hypothetical protein BGZ61DRAFT_343755 [Ilyonectria robusta]
MADVNSPTAPLPSCPFQKIPLEVLLRITCFLGTPDLGRVRLTCRSIEQSLDTTFIKEFFTRKQFMLSDHSLQALIDISKSRLGVHLRMVHFGLDHYPPPTAVRRTANDQYEKRQLERYADMFTLWSTGYQRDMLAEAFRNLPNLEDVVIRDFNSRKRARDGPFFQWTSYGSTTANRETDSNIIQNRYNSREQKFTSNFSSQVFSAVLMALGQAGARPKGIEVMARNNNHLKSFAFNIPPYMEASVLPVLQNLEKLHLDVNMIWRTEPVVSAPDPNLLLASDFMLCKFLLNTTHLRHLRINEAGKDDIRLSGFLICHLEELNLGFMHVEASWVLNVVRKVAPTLKRLQLWKLTLRRGLPDNHVGAPPKVNFWGKFLERLKGIPGLELRHIMVGSVQQHWYSRPSHSLVTFRDGNSMMNYTGTDWRHYVGEEIAGMKVLYAHDEGDRSQGSDEDDGLWDQYALDL